MTSMIRGLALATLVLMLTPGIAGQAVGVLRIKVSLVDAQSRPAPVSRHAFLLSENPTSAPPRVIVTGADGTVDVKLRAGNYTVESERAVAFEGKTYEWVQLVDIVAGRDTVLELTPANADTSGRRPRPRDRSPTRRSCCRDGRTAWSRSGRRPVRRPACWSTRTD